MEVLTLNKKLLDNSKGVPLDLLLLAVAAALYNNTNIEQQSSLAFAAGKEDDNVLHVRKESITTDIFELVSGIFSAILCVLSLRAYTKLKMKGMLFVSAVFGIFAVRTIAIKTRDIYVGGGKSPALESILSFMFLIALVLFFIAIVQRENIKQKHRQPDI